MKYSDELNPAFIFSQTDTQLLIDAMNGKIDLEQLAMKELAKRGRDINGEWKGFSDQVLEIADDIK